MGHARNSPSDAKRWITCPGAINRCRALGLDKSESSGAAREGTAAHHVREICLEFGFEPYDMLGATIEVEDDRYVVDTEMADFLQPGIDRVREFNGKLFTEMRVNITPWTGKDEHGNDQYGTLDAGVCGDDLIVISDLKYGVGIPVQAVGNYQQIIYGLAFWKQIARHFTKARKFLIIIDQPRNGQGGGEWEISLDEMLRIGEYVKERASLTFDKNAPCIPSEEGCLWCPASRQIGACPEYEAWNLAFLDVEIDDLDDFNDLGTPIEMPEVEGLTIPRVRAIYDHISVMRAFLKRVEAQVADAVKAGDGDAYGKKLVLGKRTNRKHKDEDKSQEWLLDEGYKEEQIITKKLKTPAQLDKVCGKGVFPKDLIVGGEKSQVIAPIEDARPAIPVGAIIQEFVDELDDFDD